MQIHPGDVGVVQPDLRPAEKRKTENLFRNFRSPDDLPLHDVMQRNFSLFVRCGKKVGMDGSD